MSRHEHTMVLMMSEQRECRSAAADTVARHHQVAYERRAQANELRRSQEVHRQMLALLRR
jgi:hypothetical protein